MRTRDSRRGHREVDHHFVLVLPKVLEGIGRPRIALEAWHYELFEEATQGDFLQEW